MSAKRARFAIALVLAAGLMALLIVLSLRGSLEQFVGPSQLEAEGLATSNAALQLNGKVVAGYGADPGAAAQTPAGLRFVVADKTHPAARIPVVYRGNVPDTFAPNVEVVVTGRMEHGVLVAQRGALTTLCPSKFQAQGTQHPANIPIDQSSPKA